MEFADDCFRYLAEIGARALLTDGLVGRRLELTGPQSLTYAEMVTLNSNFHSEVIPDLHSAPACWILANAASPPLFTGLVR
jgi:hypothetical protein